MNKCNIIENIPEFNNLLDSYDNFIMKDIDKLYMIEKLEEYNMKVQRGELNLWATLPDKGVIIEDFMDESLGIPVKRYFIYDAKLDFVDVYCESPIVFGFTSRFRFNAEVKNGAPYHEPLVNRYEHNSLIQELATRFKVYLSYIDCLNSIKITEVKRSAKKVRNKDIYYKNISNKNNNLIVINDKKIEYVRYPQNEIEKRVYSRKTQSWNVRGFYRHYKSGKVVFINSYQKGKGKSSPKKYLIK